MRSAAVIETVDHGVLKRTYIQKTLGWSQAPGTCSAGDLTVRIMTAVGFAAFGASAWSGTVASSAFAEAHNQSPKAAMPAECAPPLGWETIAARKPRFVVFGEIHGTKQAPVFIGDLACGLAAEGKRVLLAIEHSSTENEAFQRTWKLPQAAFAAKLKQAGWAGRADGVASEAMLALLVRLNGLAQNGYAIDIVAFNGAKDEAQTRRFSYLPAQGPHEAAQAENIRTAEAAKAYDYVLILVGNIHARKRPVERSGIAFEPMAMQLGSPSAVITLNMQTAGGTTWNCQLKPGVQPKPKEEISNDAIACASYPLRANANYKRAPFIALTERSASNTDADYDGVFWLGTVDASPPAVPRGK